MPGMTVAEINAFMAREMPDILELLVIEDAAPGTATLRLPFRPQHLRPGGTIHGPALMTLVDVATYIAILATLGPIALAVTTNLNINFLRRPARADVIGVARLLKTGRRLVVSEITATSEGETEPVAHATATYSIPPADDRER